MAIGAIAAVGAGFLALVVGQPVGWAVITGLGLGLPVALFGAGYAYLVAIEKFPIGVFTPAAAYWLVGFPLAMLVHSIVTAWVVTGAPALPQGPLWQFLAYNALLSMGFAIGFLWSHEYLGRHWWPRIRDHNVYADRCVEAYVGLAVSLHEREQATKRGRREKKLRARQAAELKALAKRG